MDTNYLISNSLHLNSSDSQKISEPTKNEDDKRLVANGHNVNEIGTIQDESQMNGVIYNRHYIQIENPISKAPLLAIGVKSNGSTLFFDIDTTNNLDNDIIQKEVMEFYKNTIPRIIFGNESINEIRQLDNTYKKIESFLEYKERQFFYIYNGMLNHYHWATYKTKHGYHLVKEMPTVERTQMALYELKVIFPQTFYFMKPKQLRLRITPKWNKYSGDIVSPEPMLYSSCKCYTESRTGDKESYLTYD